MIPKYIDRSLEPILKKAAAEFPAVVLTGPRQSGKTTLLKHLFGADCGYVSLEPPDVRAAALEDPRGFLAMHPPPVILDEVQYAPDLLAYVKEKIDMDRHVPGRYLLTGSQNLLLMEQITESLAGRAAMLRLLPLSRREAQGARPRLVCLGKPRTGRPWKQRALVVESGKTFCGGVILSWLPIPTGTPAYGMAAMCRPTWSGTCAPSAKSAI